MAQVSGILENERNVFLAYEPRQCHLGPDSTMIHATLLTLCKHCKIRDTPEYKYRDIGKAEGRGGGGGRWGIQFLYKVLGKI